MSVYVVLLPATVLSRYQLPGVSSAQGFTVLMGTALGLGTGFTQGRVGVLSTTTGGLTTGGTTTGGFTTGGTTTGGLTSTFGSGGFGCRSGLSATGSGAIGASGLNTFQP